MSIQFYPTTTDEVTLPMACDPAVAEANEDEVLAEFLRTSDPKDLIVPEGATLVTFRPLSHADIAKARAEAGMTPMFGLRVHGQLEKAEDPVKASQNLSEEEQRAIAEYEHWLYRMRTAMVVRSVKAVSGWDVPAGKMAEALDQVRPIEVRNEFLLELSIHAHRLSTLAPEGKG